MAETETLTIFLEKRPRRDVGTSRDRLETETTTLIHVSVEASASSLNSFMSIAHLPVEQPMSAYSRTNPLCHRLKENSTQNCSEEAYI